MTKNKGSRCQPRTGKGTTIRGRRRSSIKSESSKDEILKLRKFVQRVYDACEYDIEIGKKHPNLEVPSDLCIWDLFEEAKELLNLGD